LAEVRPDDEVEEALAAMQRTGTHLARVVVPRAADTEVGDGAGEPAAETTTEARAAHPAGQVIGVVFLEDILEELVGEVRDAMQRRLPGAS